MTAAGALAQAWVAGPKIATTMQHDGRDHLIGVLMDSTGQARELTYQGAESDPVASALAEICVLATGWLRLGLPAVEVGRAFVTHRLRPGPAAALIAATVKCERESARVVRELARPGARRGRP